GLSAEAFAPLARGLACPVVAVVSTRPVTGVARYDVRQHHAAARPVAGVALAAGATAGTRGAAGATSVGSGRARGAGTAAARAGVGAGRAGAAAGVAEATGVGAGRARRAAFVAARAGVRAGRAMSAHAGVGIVVDVGARRAWRAGRDRRAATG